MANKELTKEQIIDIAVNWWAKKLERPHHDNGDDSYPSQMGMIMADMIARKNCVTEEQMAIFKRELAAKIEVAYEQGVINGFGQVWLSCDYAPCDYLEEPAKAAGINLLNFPFKTHMLITKGEVKVSDGYAQPYVNLTA